MIKDKIKSLEGLIPILDRLKSKGKAIVSTNGVFDILHPGNVKYLEKAKKQGDVLIVAVNSDSSVKMNKGPNRPINPQKARCEVLAALESVDYVFVFKEKDPRNWISKIKPNIHAKAGDYKKKSMIEHDEVLKNGGKIMIIKFEKGFSTTKIIEKSSRQ